jgi:hypothetical protein
VAVAEARVVVFNVLKLKSENRESGAVLLVLAFDGVFKPDLGAGELEDSHELLSN